MGRPRKRKLRNADEATSGPARRPQRQTSSAEPNLFDSAIEGLDPFAGQIGFPGLDMGLDVTNETDFLTSSASDVLSDQSCAYTRDAEESNRMKTLEISDGGTAIPIHEPIGRLDSTEPLVLELTSSEWKKLAKKVVRAEVYGTSDAGRASFMSVLTTLEERQALWHKTEPTDDCPDPERRRQAMHNRNDNPICLTLAREAKKLVELFDFS
ncbi:hypothetical protein E4T39_03012 [Aureobasidium subglaciale]|nr:hypothetical protein E4T39_03012 [Aureobasidium subglaciale]